MEQPVLTTKRLTLRPVEPSDQQKVFEGFSNKTITKYFDVTYETYEATNEQMEWYKTNREKGVGYAWVITSTEISFIGIVSCYKIDYVNRKCELGYWIFPEYWGKGFATESLTALLNFVDISLKIHRITAEIEPENIASIHLVTKLQFEKEVVFRDYEYKNGKYNNLEIWTKFFPHN